MRPGVRWLGTGSTQYAQACVILGLLFTSCAWQTLHSRLLWRLVCDNISASPGVHPRRRNLLSSRVSLQVGFGTFLEPPADPEMHRPQSSSESSKATQRSRRTRSLRAPAFTGLGFREVSRLQMMRNSTKLLSTLPTVTFTRTVRGGAHIVRGTWTRIPLSLHSATRPSAVSK